MAAPVKDTEEKKVEYREDVEALEIEDGDTWTYTESENRMALYETAVHGPPLVGAAIIRHKDMKTHVEFAYPTALQRVNASEKPSKLTINDHNSWATSGLDAEKELEACFHLVPRLALGALLDSTLVDFVYFTLPTPSGNYLYGISYVARFDNDKSHTANMGTKPVLGGSYNNAQSSLTHTSADSYTADKTGGGTRYISYVRDNKNAYYIAICVISKVPFFCYIGCKLECVAQTYFHTRCFSDHQLLLSFVEQMNSKECVENWSYEALYFSLESYFKPMALCVTYRALLFILKCLMVGKSVMVYSECAARTTTAVLSLLTMIPGANALGFNSKGFGSLWHSWKKFGMPLHLFHSKYVIYPYFTSEMGELLDNVHGYFIGITDRRVLKVLKRQPDMVLNLEWNCVQLFNRSLLELYHPSMYEINYFDTFIEELGDSEEDELIKNVLDTGESIYNSISCYLAKAPSTLINIGGSLKRYVNRRSNQRRAIKCNESALGLLDKYFPGSVPNWLKKCAITKGAAPTNTTKSKPKRNVEILPQECVKSQEPEAFTVQGMFNQMAKGQRYYQYLGYIDNIQGFNDEKDRNREIEYAINNRINPMQNYLLKFLENAAYVCGDRRLMYQLLMDFTFDLGALTDCSQRVMGTVLKRGNVYLRGDLPEEDEGCGFLDTLLNLDFDFDSEDRKTDHESNAPKPGSSEKETTVATHKDQSTANSAESSECKGASGYPKFPVVNKETISKIGTALVSKSMNALTGGKSTNSPTRSKQDGATVSHKLQQEMIADLKSPERSQSDSKSGAQGASVEGSDKGMSSKQSPRLKREDSLNKAASALGNALKTTVSKTLFGQSDSTSTSKVAREADTKQRKASTTKVDGDKSKDGGTAKPERRKPTDPNTRKPGDQEINMEVTATLATRIVELQNNHSMEFLEKWLKTVCAKKFFDEHSLNTFNEPVYLANSSMAKHKYPNGDLYIGELVHLRRNGKGTYIAVDGTQYEGDWVDGKRQGEGTLISEKQGYKYSGQWHNDKREGEGTLTTPLFEYTGMFKNNQFNGRGKLIHKGGTTYEGDFENGKYNGRGRLTLLDGTIKIGAFRDNEIYGVCSVIRTDGRIYVGKLYGDVLNGKGRLIYNRLVSFEGQWNVGIREGQGVAEIKLSEDGSEGAITIDGIWHKDNLCMNEVMIKFPNGYKYVGNIAYCSDLSQVMYMTAYDEALHSHVEEEIMACENRILPHGRGIIKTHNGGTYSGELFHGMRFGKGDMIFSSGVSYSGGWAFGTVHGQADVTFPDTPEPKIINFKYGKLLDKLDEVQLMYINGCLEEVGTLGLEREFTMRNLEPCPGLLTAAPELL